MWKEELVEARIPAMIVTQELLGRENADIHDIADADVVLVDESHNFRNHTTQRYENLERILAANQRQGRTSNERKKLILTHGYPYQQ